MPHAHGYRARTRYMFKRDFRKNGIVGLSTYMRNFKVGDYVDIKVNGAVHKGMPHRFYHGRTGVVFDVTKSALGVEVNKVIRNRQMKKRIHVRVEHVVASKCRTGFLSRVVANEKQKLAVRKGEAAHVPLKRLPAQPKAGYIYKNKKAPMTVYPLKYEINA